MDKHPDLTLRRIDLFLIVELQRKLEKETLPLSIEICEAGPETYQEAISGKWSAVEPGFKWGPAYTVRWFRLKARVPEEWKGRVVLEAPVGSERTLWINGEVVGGQDWAHPHFVMPSDNAEHEIYLLAYAHNPQHRVHLRELPREELVETVGACRLIQIDEPLRQFSFDVEYAYLLLKSMEQSDPDYHHLLRAVNDAINLYRPHDPKVLKLCRSIVLEALQKLTGEINHSIWPVGHSHLDTAWLWPISITQQKMVHTTAIQLGLIDRFAEFTFAHSQASQYEWIEKQHPQLFKRLKSAIKAGRWEPVGSMWVECDCNVPSGESLVRQFLYGKRYFQEKFGVETQDMWLPDVFGYSAALPQILNKFKIKSFLTQKISWNQTNKFPHNTFIWQGIDGSQIWSHFPPADTYIGNCEPGEMRDSVKKHRDHGRSDDSLYLFGWGDGGGGVTERHIELLRRGRRAGNMPLIKEKVKAAQFFDAAQAASKDLAVWKGELYLEFHRGTYTSQAKTKKQNRESEFLLRDAEFLSCFAPSYPSAYPAEKLEAAWKLTLLNQFHDILPGSSVNEVYRDSDAEYAKVREITNQVIEEKLVEISKLHDSIEMERPHAIFHHATQPSMVELPWTDDFVPTAVETGDEVLPCQVVEAFGERKLVFNTPLAALSNVAVVDFTSRPAPIQGRLSGTAKRLENDYLSVRFDANGNIVGLRSMEDGMDVGVPGELLNVFQLFEDKPLFWSAWDIDPYTFETGRQLLKSDSFEIVEKGPVRYSVEMVKTFGNSRIKQRISLGQGPGLVFDTEVDWHEEDMLLKVAFPVNLNASRATFEIQCGYLDRPTHRNTSWDAAMFEVCAQKFVDLSEGNRGVALLNDCKYGHDVLGNVMRMTLLRAPKAPDPECDMGVHRFRYCLLPHYGPFQMAGVTHHALAFNTPLRSAKLRPREGESGMLPHLLTVDNDNLVIQSVKRSESGDALIVRLYEAHNTRGHAELTCVRRIAGAAWCYLDESEEYELDVIDGAVQFSFKPFEIITIKLRV